MKGFVINPFFYYGLSFLLSFFIYGFGWSDLYENLSNELIFFVLVTSILSLVIGFIVSSIIKIKIIDKNIMLSYKNIKLINFLYITMAALEYAYSGGIPLVNYALGKSFNYQEFGIPTLHVFFAVYMAIVNLTFFYRFLITKDKKYLPLIFFSFFYYISIFSRASLFVEIMGMALIYLFLLGSLRKLLYISIFSILFLYIFGVVGNYRMAALGYDNEDAILVLGKASKDFQNSYVPTEFFWSYLYLSSPLANLNYQNKNFLESDRSISEFFYNNILIDTLSKRIASKNRENKLIDESLNVSTMYGGSIQTYGYEGISIFYVYYIFVCVFLILFSPRKFLPIMLVLLCILSFFSIFTNFIRLSGFILQPIFILVLGRITINRNFLI